MTIGVVPYRCEAASELRIDDGLAHLFFTEASERGRCLRQRSFSHQEFEIAGVDMNRSKVNVHRLFMNAEIWSEFQQALCAKAETTGGSSPGKSAPPKLHDHRPLF